MRASPAPRVVPRIEHHQALVGRLAHQHRLRPSPGLKQSVSEGAGIEWWDGDEGAIGDVYELLIAQPDAAEGQALLDHHCGDAPVGRIGDRDLAAAVADLEA